LFHHIVVLSAFLVTLITRLYLGIVVVGLLMEINSIFLHTRSIMNLNGVRKSSYSFRLIALLNITTFIVFRMVVNIYLLYWQFSPSTLARVPWYLVIINSVVILSMGITNSVLLYRVLAADGVLGKKRARRHNSNAAHEPSANVHHHTGGHSEEQHNLADVIESDSYSSDAYDEEDEETTNLETGNKNVEEGNRQNSGQKTSDPQISSPIIPSSSGTTTVDTIIVVNEEHEGRRG